MGLPRVCPAFISLCPSFPSALPWCPSPAPGNPLYKRGEKFFTMSQGTLFANDRIRALIPKALVNEFKLDVKVVDASGKAFEQAFPLGKVPAFIGPKGVKLTEVIAVSLYRM